ncbi:hypothetical protein L2X99_00565 [Microbacterium sp. KUDC0406]|uniref:HAAS signaling domain-containing protein n=1 Tax=Microbacterium sp. KUDC0406 TaxID=2909588 RepID=UPI001F3E286F|nr:hypothetical protein [Microbacterium sp. KUDC0406]UJP10251.1 hypothetical protein L2X99_00565 [Microbacterium sp. KUDC0406]
MTVDPADYLAGLDAALRDVPHGIASDIRAGIAEELAGLAPGAAAARIAQLGDPAEIAREAMDAGGAQRSVVAAPAAKPPVTATKGFAIIAALALSFGGFVIPVVGWFVGAALVGMSGLWRTWEKVVAIVTPLVSFGFILLLSIPVYTVESSVTESSPDVANPLMPTTYDVVWTAVIVLAWALIPASGLWLLWRLRGRTAPAAS